VLDVHFVLVGVAAGIVGQVAYTRDTLRGAAQPNRITYLLWGVAPLIAFAVEAADGVGLRSLMALTAGVGPLVILAASFAKNAGVWRVGTFDYVCGALSVAGTLGWLLTRHGIVALAAAIAADAVAAVPTVVKSWRYPSSESGGVYVGGLINAACTLLTVDHMTASQVAFPAYIFVVGLVPVILVIGGLGPRISTRARTKERANDRSG
jgi:hypothetical protein